MSNRPNTGPDSAHREPILQLLDRYLRRWPGEAATVERIRRLVERHPDCLNRTCLPGHVTASCWIASNDGASFLLTHHRKLNRWLQLGGHVDGESDLPRAALREAREESGLIELDFFRETGRILTVDLDVHLIPARPGEPEHEHHDVRFLLIAGPDQQLVKSAESNDLRWFENSDLPRVAGDQSVLRLGRKALRLLAAT